MKEIVFIDQFCEFLTSIPYEFKREVRKLGHHSDGYVDIVIKNHGILIGIEAKMNSFASVIAQASGNRLLFPYNYILVPKLSNYFLKIARRRGLGVIIPKDDRFEIILKPSPPFEQWYIDRYIRNSLRNWIQNRKGRLFSQKELPPNYSQEKLDQLHANKNWRGSTYDPYNMDWEALGFKKLPMREPKPPKKKKKLRKLSFYM